MKTDDPCVFLHNQTCFFYHQSENPMGTYRWAHFCSLSFHILVGDEVQSSRIQAYSPRAPVVVYRVATPIMPNGHMRSCPGRAGTRLTSASVFCGSSTVHSVHVLTMASTLLVGRGRSSATQGSMRRLNPKKSARDMARECLVMSGGSPSYLIPP